MNNEWEVCTNCQGDGHYPTGKTFVSRDMATDAGEPEMEGMHHGYQYVECEDCEGIGYTKSI